MFVAGVELSVMNRGFLSGDSPEERVEHLMRRPERRAEAMRELGSRINAFLREAAATVRERFRGRLTYAAIQFEQIDWTPFDMVTYELIRSAEVADRFRDAVRTLAQGPKPLAVTGFGTAAYRGAGDRGGRVLEVVEHDPATRAPVRLTGVYERDEAGQAAYLSELLEIFETEGWTARSCSCSPCPATPTARTATPGTTWTGPAWASSNSSKDAGGRPTPTWNGSPRPPSRPSRSGTGGDRNASHARSL